MARRSKYTPETVDLICEGLMLGMTQKHAAEYAGINEDTFILWRNKHSDFADRLREAISKRRRLWLSQLLKAGQNDWRAIADLMDRCEPDYRKKSEVAMTGKDGKPIEVNVNHRDLSMFTDDEIDKLAAIAEQRMERI